MQSHFRDMWKHSAVYGLGQVLARLSSFLMLPVYTSYLRPADYGVIALLDFVGGIFGLLIGARIGRAVTRYHFEAKDDVGRNQVWWTGLTIVVCTASVSLFVAMLFRDTLAFWILGPTVQQGEFFLALILPTVGLSIVWQVLDVYLRVRKWSGISVSMNFFRLVLNIGLNVYFLAVLDLGVTGVLTGNLIAGVVGTFILFVIFLKNQGWYSFHYPLVEKLMRFAGPLVLTALLSLLMHQSGRYLLRFFVDLDQVGIYSLAYMIGQGVYTLCFLPFTMIWGVMMYEIADRPDAKQTYVWVFEYTTYGLALIFFGAALFAEPVLGLMVNSEYMPATRMIPIICLAYLFFSMHDHFKVPVLLTKSTSSVVPVAALAALTNIGANFLLIPVFGMMGAAWASVIAYGVYSMVGLWRYRKIDKYDYPLWKCLIMILGMVASYGMYDRVAQIEGIPGGPLSLAIFLWLGWFLILFGSFIRQLAARYVWVPVRNLTSSSRDHSR